MFRQPFHETLNELIEAGGFFKIAEGLEGRQLQKQMNTDFASLKLLYRSRIAIGTFDLALSAD
jgi:hypothetical protein